MKKLITLSLVFLLSAAASAQEKSLSDSSYLNKLSMALRGYAPSMEEYSNLQKAQSAPGGSAAFLQESIQNYMQTPHYRERMVLRIDDLLFLKASSTNLVLNPPTTARNNGFLDYKQLSSTQNLSRAIAKNNLSWDKLLTGKDYTVPYFEGENYNELAFYDGPRGTKQDLTYSFLDINPPSTPPKFADIHFAENDPRIAGVITTQRFYARYTTTALNKNRRRAAAVFRIFLCDPMAAAIPEVHDTSKLKDLIFPANGQVSESQVREILSDKHGTQEDCMKCHYKLDPLGATLRASPLVLHERPSSGSLVYRRANGEMVNQHVAGVGELAKVITEQPEYAACQVGYFWNWFIGSDMPRTAEINQELVAKFNQLNRKTNDFVAYIVSRPEFRQRKLSTPQSAMASNVRAFLQRCDSCHMSQQPHLPQFAKWPIGDACSAKSWLRQISKELDLEHGGENRNMPPEDGFRPSKGDLKLIKQWIELGAPDDQGKVMVTP
ncbi:DUF1588 domain-containing protein [Bdellovibrio sp. KM01]|uniref:DUF1588 domain-containing protein n=1 Tax=Bdellovibrio sp. KM01 TaxID=2748865 RepID=UPI0015E9E07C|nr:DUF1588 domain-containing protein [Bdellovibrio sp. KM01]QLY23886.1 DUF1588 domain-containing protein [Bdellovibrio sp. KM01]